jgi:murein DD-endopeptidase MepM/ murein hydrolase activator NlpD
MKKNQYIAAVACLAAGIIGFGSVYATEKAQERREAQQLAEQETQDTQTEEMEETSGIVEPKQTGKAQEEKTAQENAGENAQSASAEDNVKAAQETASSDDGTTNNIEETASVATDTDEAQETVSVSDSLHFQGTEDLVWPLEGNVILDYSMDSTIYFPTLEQYRYNPAVIISGSVNDKVYLIAKGQITDISENEVTGCTVTEDLGDGYTAIYGQLKELNFDVGDMVEAGQVIGYVSEPTKYYSVEGSNLYFEMQKDGEPVNPLDYFE